MRMGWRNAGTDPLMTRRAEGTRGAPRVLAGPRLHLGGPVFVQAATVQRPVRESELCMCISRYMIYEHVGTL